MGSEFDQGPGRNDGQKGKAHAKDPQTVGERKLRVRLISLDARCRRGGAAGFCQGGVATFWLEQLGRGFVVTVIGRKRAEGRGKLGATGKAIALGDGLGFSGAEVKRPDKQLADALLRDESIEIGGPRLSILRGGRNHRERCEAIGDDHEEIPLAGE